MGSDTTLWSKVEAEGRILQEIIISYQVSIEEKNSKLEVRRN